MPLDLTIVIPTKNEAKQLPACLQAIGKDFAAEVVMVDSNSEDGTPQIGSDWGAKVVAFDWNGQFPKKRNWYLRNHQPNTTWVLFLDADEIVTQEFKRELSRVLVDTHMQGFWLRYTIYFLDKRLRFGYPLSKLALFRVGAGEYEKIDERAWSRLDMEIHEHPVIQGPVGVIHSKIDHRDFRSISSYVEKHNEYSSWEAHRFLARGADPSELTWKQRLKYRLVNSPLAGPVYFCGAYFLMGGCLDGSRGLAFALLKMSYFTQIYCKIRELKESGAYAAHEKTGNEKSRA